MDLTTDLGHRVVDKISRARDPRELIDAVLESLTLHGLRGSWGGLRGDEVVMAGVAVPDDDTTRVEEILGVPLGSMRFQLAAYGSFTTAVRRRTSIIEEAFPTRLISMFPHLTDAEKVAVRHHIGAGPLMVAPITDGDVMLGLLLAWGPGVTSQRHLVETLAALAGIAWHRVQGHTEKTGALSKASVSRTGDLARYVGEILAPGNIRAALQPVVRLGDRTVLGYEALCRFTPRGDLRTPDELFAAAGSHRQKASILDAACLHAAFAAATHTAPATLFVNVAVETLVEGSPAGDRLSRMAEIAGVSPDNVVLEVSERTPVGDLTRLRRVVAELRARGFRIAIDDAGAGHASMLVIAEVQPEFIKIDRQLIHDIDVSAARRALAVSLLSFGAHISARVIAEGIETEQELQTLLSLGLQFGQGWHLGHPVMVAPPADARGVVAVKADWFTEQRVASFRTSVNAAVPEVGAADAEPGTRTRKRTALPRALMNSAAALQSERDPARIIEVIAEEVQSVVPVSAVYIYAVDESQNRFVPVYATGSEAKARMAYSYSTDLGLNGWALKIGTPQNVGNVSAHPATITIPGTPVGEPESYLIIPLIAGDRRLGVLDCSRLGLDQFTSRDLEAAALFGHSAAAAWRNAELYAELTQRAILDPLTGLLNSRWLREVGEREASQSLRSGESLAVLLLDLDGFKQINDTGGHSAGDLVLRRVGAVLSSVIRAGDAAIRLGGEEFLLLLRDADAAGAERVATEFRDRLAELALPRSCLPRRKLTASTGVAILPRNGTALAELVRAADSAMYEAKRAGGDRFQLSTHRRNDRRAVRQGNKIRGAA